MCRKQAVDPTCFLFISPPSPMTNPVSTDHLDETTEAPEMENPQKEELTKERRKQQLDGKEKQANDYKAIAIDSAVKNAEIETHT